MLSKVKKVFISLFVINFLLCQNGAFALLTSGPAKVDTTLAQENLDDPTLPGFRHDTNYVDLGKNEVDLLVPLTADVVQLSVISAQDGLGVDNAALGMTGLQILSSMLVRKLENNPGLAIKPAKKNKTVKFNLNQLSNQFLIIEALDFKIFKVNVKAFLPGKYVVKAVVDNQTEATTNIVVGENFRIDNIYPPIVGRGISTILTLFGEGLDAYTRVSFENSGIMVLSRDSINDGKTYKLGVEVDSGASIGFSDVTAKSFTQGKQLTIVDGLLVLSPTGGLGVDSFVSGGTSGSSGGIDLDALMIMNGVDGMGICADPSDSLTINVEDGPNAGAMFNPDECILLIDLVMGGSGPAGPGGASGLNGFNGSDGISVVSSTSIEDPGENCATGGVKVDVAQDVNMNMAIDPNDITQTFYICNGAMGIQGIACWDKNENGEADFADDDDYTEDLNSDGVIDVKDCVSYCWDLNGNSVGDFADGDDDYTEDLNGDGLVNVNDCSGLHCWDLNGNGSRDLGSEDLNGDAVVDVKDCKGVACWDQNENGVGDLDGEDDDDYSEDVNGDETVDVKDCKGIACWDLDGDGLGDITDDDDNEDLNDDSVVNVADCKGEQGEQGITGISCWDTNQNGEGDLDTEDDDSDYTEDVTGDGVVDALDCKGLACWDTNGNGLGDTNDDIEDDDDYTEDLNGDDLVNALDCKLLCWDLNGNGVGDPAEDTNGDLAYNVLDCKGAKGDQGEQGPQGEQGESAINIPTVREVISDWKDLSDEQEFETDSGALTRLVYIPEFKEIIDQGLGRTSESSYGGFWVGKYEAAKNDATSTTEGTGTVPISKRNVVPWANVAVAAAKAAIENSDAQIPGLGDCHLITMKEWQALYVLGRYSKESGKFSASDTNGWDERGNTRNSKDERNSSSFVCSDDPTQPAGMGASLGRCLTGTGFESWGHLLDQTAIVNPDGSVLGMSADSTTNSDGNLEVYDLVGNVKELLDFSITRSGTMAAGIWTIDSGFPGAGRTLPFTTNNSTFNFGDLSIDPDLAGLGLPVDSGSTTDANGGMNSGKIFTDSDNETVSVARGGAYDDGSDAPSPLTLDIDNSSTFSSENRGFRVVCDPPEGD